MSDFDLLSEGLSLVKTLDENSASFFDDLARLREIIQALGEDAGESVPAIKFHGVSEQEKLESLVSYARDHLPNQPEFIRIHEADNLDNLSNHGVRIPPHETQPQAQVMQYAAAYQADEITEEHQVAAYQHYSANGVPVNINKERIIELLNSVDAMSMNDFAPYIELKSELDKNHKRLRELSVIIKDATKKAESEMDESYLEQARKHVEEYEDLYDKRYGKQFDANFAAIKSQFLELKNRELAYASEQGQKIINDMLERSPISQEEAEAWANAQVFDQGATNKLKRQKYPKEEVLKDMAEAYRLSGGKLPPINISTTRSTRAHASGIENVHGYRSISIGSNFSKRTLFHELAHHFESDSLAKAASNGYLVSRRESEKVYRLSQLTGWKGYGRREVAYKDDFIHPYIGKVYNDGVTEVFAMGFEYLADPKQAAMFFAKDPDMSAMISGYLAADLVPTAKARKEFYEFKQDERAVEAESQAKAQKELDERVQQGIKNLADVTSIEPSAWWTDSSIEEQEGIIRYALRVDRKDEKGVVYIGSLDADQYWHVFSGRFRNPETGRKAKGYALLWVSKQGRAQLFTHKELDTVKAIIRIGEYDGDTRLYSMYRTYLKSTKGAASEFLDVYNGYMVENLGVDEV